MKHPLYLLYGAVVLITFVAGARLSHRSAGQRWTADKDEADKERAFARVERAHRRLLVTGSILCVVVTLVLALS